MTKEEYEAVKAAICPYCAAKLPDTLHGLKNDAQWVHAIARTEYRFDCLASRFRTSPPSEEGWVTE
jgi:hypothetical protein